MKTVVVVKATVKWSVRNCRPDRGSLVFLLGVGFTCFWVEIIEIQVPFTDDRGVVALRFQKAGDGRPIFRDQAGREPSDDALLQSCPPTVSSRHQTVASRCTNR